MIAMDGAKELRFIKSFIINYSKAVSESPAFENDYSFWYRNVIAEVTNILNLSKAYINDDIKKFDESIIDNYNPAIIQIYKMKTLNNAHFVSWDGKQLDVYKSARRYMLTIDDMLERYNRYTDKKIKKFRTNSVVICTSKCTFTASAGADLTKDEIYKYIHHASSILIRILIEHTERADYVSDGVLFSQESFSDFIKNRFLKYETDHLDRMLYYHHSPSAALLDFNEKQIAVLLYRAIKNRLLKCNQSDFDYIINTLKRLFVALDDGFSMCSMHNFVNGKYHSIKYINGTELLVSTEIQDLCGMIQSNKQPMDEIIQINIFDTCSINVYQDDLDLQYFNLTTSNQYKCIKAAILMCINDGSETFTDVSKYSNSNLMILLGKGYLPTESVEDVKTIDITNIDTYEKELSDKLVNHVSGLLNDIKNSAHEDKMKTKETITSTKISYGTVDKTKFADGVMSSILNVGVDGSIITKDMNLLNLSKACHNAIAKDIAHISNIKMYEDIKNSISLHFLCALSMSDIRMYTFCEVPNNEYVAYELSDDVLDVLVGEQINDNFKNSGLKFPLYIIGNKEMAIALKYKNDKLTSIKSVWKDVNEFVYDSMLMLEGALLQAHIMYSNYSGYKSENNIVLKDSSFKELLHIFESNALLNTKDNVDALLFMLDKKNKTQNKLKLNCIKSIDLPTGERYVTKENNTYDYNKSDECGIFDYKKMFKLNTKDVNLTILPCKFTNDDNFVDDIVKILRYLKFVEDDKNDTKKNKKCNQAKEI